VFPFSRYYTEDVVLTVLHVGLYFIIIQRLLEFYEQLLKNSFTSFAILTVQVNKIVLGIYIIEFKVNSAIKNILFFLKQLSEVIMLFTRILEHFNDGLIVRIKVKHLHQSSKFHLCLGNSFPQDINWLQKFSPFLLVK